MSRKQGPPQLGCVDNRFSNPLPSCTTHFASASSRMQSRNMPPQFNATEGSSYLGSSWGQGFRTRAWQTKTVKVAVKVNMDTRRWDSR